MIFKTLFKKKKWLSDKVSDRLAAVAELELSDNGNKAVFHELAFNDGDDKVRRATLDKLNDFSLWWQAYKNDPSAAIKRYAEKVLIEALCGERECRLDDKLKRQFVEECNKTALLEQVVFKLQDEVLTISVVKRLEKETLIVSGLLNDSLSESTRFELLELLTDTNQLKKLQKRLEGGLLDAVDAKLAAIQIAKDKPVKLEKQVRLLLAQINSLKDKPDFALIQQKRSEYEGQWQTLTQDFDCFDATLKQALLDKYALLIEQVERIAAPLKQAFEAEQRKAEKAEKEAQNAAKIEQRIVEIEARVSSVVAADVELNQEKIAAEINIVVSQCNELELTDESKKTLLAQAESVFNRANQVPQIKQAIANASQLIETFSGLSIPKDIAEFNETADAYYQLRAQWKANLAEADIALPAELAEKYQALNAKWRAAIGPLEKEQQQTFSQMRRKLSELSSLIEDGRYNNAFGLFKKLGFWYASLNDKQQAQISRKWQTAQEQMADLQELQRAISNPKRQEIIEQINTLAQSPLVDATEQAHRVRMLRKNWQSLGQLAQEDSALGEQFDQLSEQAFAPCREHYKELEDERADNLKAKKLILTNLQTMSANLETAVVSNWRELESAFVKLTKLWRETGHIDRELVDDINNEYQSLVKPIRQAINDHHKENETAKRSLIEKAEKLAAQDLPVEEIIGQLKGLQQQWQKIGFAGKNQDQKLWAAFRAVNNPVFDKRDEQKRSADADEKAQLDQLFEQFSQLESDLKSADTLALIKELAVNLEELFDEVTGLSKGAFDKVKKKQHGLKKRIDEKLTKLRSEQERQVYLDLFQVVTALIQGEAADMSTLKTAWANAINNPGKLDREQVTLQLEINEGIETANVDKALRNEVQMKMLTAKMEQGVEFHKNDLLESWLAAGPFVDGDLSRLERIKAIF